LDLVGDQDVGEGSLVVIVVVVAAVDYGDQNLVESLVVDQNVMAYFVADDEDEAGHFEADFVDLIDVVGGEDDCWDVDCVDVGTVDHVVVVAVVAAVVAVAAADCAFANDAAR
jgi:hypothetical protein